MKYRFEHKVEDLKEIERQTVKDCKILYGSDDSHESFIWESDYGWSPVISELSYKIEALNLMIKAFGLKVVAHQVKEKFGGLRFYFGVDIYPKFSCRFWFLNKLFKALQKIDYMMVRVESPDGKRIHFKPSRFGALYKFLCRIGQELEEHRCFPELSDEQRIMSKAIHEIVDRLVEGAEEECSRTCISCGRSLAGDEHGLMCRSCTGPKPSAKTVASDIDDTDPE